MLQVASINSGSNGNCYYIGNAHDAILIDAGISPKEIENRLRRMGLSLKKVRALFVTHEHMDHIKGISSLSKKNKLPVYISEPTLRESRLRIKEHLVRSFTNHEPVSVGGLSVIPFPTQHDAADPHCFLVREGGVNVGVITDVGIACDQVVRYFQQCHVAFLESNYDAELLETGSYPVALKNRIRGGKGHISNAQALDLFLHHRPDHMTHLFLGHLSKHNNSPTIVENLFRPLAGGVEIVIASRYRETGVYHLNEAGRAYTPGVAQLELF